MSIKPQTVTTAEEQQVSAAIANWLAAWSRKDVDAYLASYAKDFAAPGSHSRWLWENKRRARIVGKSWIAVKISGLKIRLDNDEAHVTFLQNYRSDSFSEISPKMLTLVKVDNRWLIRQEQSIE